MYKPIQFIVTALALLFVANLLNPRYEAAKRTGFENTSTRGTFKEGNIIRDPGPYTYTIEATDYEGKEHNITVKGDPPAGVLRLGPFSVKDNTLLYGTEKDATPTPRHSARIR
jgi:hypothetical protein